MAAALGLGLLAGCSGGSGGGAGTPAGTPEPSEASTSPEAPESSGTPDTSGTPGAGDDDGPPPEADSPCYDGECEITVAVGTEIAVDPAAFGVTRLVVTGIEEQELAAGFSSPAVLYDVYDGSEVVATFSSGVGTSSTTNDSLTVFPADVDVAGGSARLEITPRPPAR